jgi:hypothetical protein
MADRLEIVAVPANIEQKFFLAVFISRKRLMFCPARLFVDPKLTDKVFYLPDQVNK